MKLVDATLRSKVFSKRGFRDEALLRSIVTPRPATETTLFGTPRRARHASHRHPAARAAGLLRWPGRRDHSACDAATRPTPPTSFQLRSSTVSILRSTMEFEFIAISSVTFCPILSMFLRLVSCFFFDIRGLTTGH